jgi:hypothetical protein
MRSLILACIIVFSCGAFAQGVGRVYDLYQDLDMLPERTAVAFFNGDSLEINVYVFLDGSPVTLPSQNLFLTWELMNHQVPNNTIYAFSGTAASLTNGHIRVSLRMDETDIPAGEYDGYLRASIGEGFFATQYMVVQKHEVSVREGYP